jgi:hypothetical protein
MIKSILVLFFLMNLVNVLLGVSVMSGQLSVGRSVGNDGAKKEVSDYLENIELVLPNKKRAIQPGVKEKLLKKSKRTKSKRKFLFGWRNMMKYFVVSVYDPTCHNHLRFSSARSSSLPAAAVGLVPSSSLVFGLITLLLGMPLFSRRTAFLPSVQSVDLMGAFDS